MAAASKKLIEVYVDLLNLLECPVCLKYGSTNTPPIKICKGAHFVCGACAEHLDACPICRGEYTDVRLTILEQIIEALAYPCFKIGCGAMLSINDLYSHELHCTYQEDRDIKYNKNMIQSQNILKHIEENYSDFYLKPEDSITELNLCMNCLNVGLSDVQDELPSKNCFDNNQRTKHELQNLEEPEDLSTTWSDVPQSSGIEKSVLRFTTHSIETKEVGIQCNLDL